MDLGQNIVSMKALEKNSLSDIELTNAEDFENGDDDTNLIDSKDDLDLDVKTDVMVSKGNSSIASSSFNFINSIIGAGIIGIPYSIRESGFVFGIILLFLVAYVTDFSILLLVKSGDKAKVNTYQGLVKAAFGRNGYIILSICQFVFPFSAMMGYCVIIGDTIPVVLFRATGSELLGNRQFIIAIAVIFVMLPISSLKKIGNLGAVSFVSLVCVVYIVIVVIVRAGTLSTVVPKTPGAWNFGGFAVPQAIGVMAFAFACHHNTFLIYDSLKTRTIGTFKVVTHISVVASLAFTMILGVAGYCTFTGFTQADLLNNYCDNDDVINAARVCYGLTMIFTYPIECFVCREVIENAFFHERPFSMVRHLGVTLIIVLITMAVALATNCLGIVIELSGTMGASPIVFIFPAACYIKFHPEEPLKSYNKIMSITLIIVGIVVGSVGTVMAIISASGCINAKLYYPWCSYNNVTNITYATPPPIF
ncbi:putative sodium-coupled neutral amino acid transporter 11 [Trichoplax sp. H2]|nr:putative sodium-coupled neutral amino acid transporter 11 [Trichoplax sp. H2]|eukprot:RDD38570.1 putative sodium-coupled neutral amino acid transporter 11 [Trichoplax sp. H2]